jgi:methylated-DNA-protein-cysteine methyltransferase-like protein
MKAEDKNFFERVYAVVKKIPRGRATSYGAIANYLGTGLSARTVGWAMNNCHSQVPAHRVVNRQGLLTGKHHFATPTLMEELLEAEGVEVIENKIQNFKKIFWDPAVEFSASSSKNKKPGKKISGYKRSRGL